MKKDLSIALAAVLLVLAAAWALAAARPDRPLTPSQPFSPAAKEAGAKKVLAPDDKIVMHVNGEPITEREFQMFLEQAPEQARGFYASPAGRRALADELVKLKALEQEGIRLGLADDPSVRSQVDATRAQIIAGRTLQKLMSEGNDARLRAEFEKEKTNSVDLSHIILAYEGSGVQPRGGAQAGTVEAAILKANGLAARIRAGESFASVAEKESDDVQSGSRGGSLGTIQLNDANLPPDVAAVITNLPPGQVSAPVRTQFGVHLFKKAAPSFEAMKPALVQKLQRELLESTMQRLTHNAKVELDPKFFPQQRIPLEENRGMGTPQPQTQANPAQPNP